MTINWDNIKYLFQLPLEWFRAIHNKVFNAYGTNFIRVKDGDDGGMQIDVDENTFKQQVLDITGGGSGGGTVKSVDGLSPDTNGNVPLGAIRSINGNFYPDANGNVEVGLGVSSVNGEQPDANGNVEIDTGSVNSVNGVSPDANGNVEIDVGTVKSVNSTAPDANGNVQLDIGTVKSVNSTSPDANGNVTLDVGVKSVNGMGPDSNGNVEVGTVRSVNGVIPVGGNVSLGTIIHSVDSVSSQDFGNLHLNAVRSVNGKTTDFEHNYNVTIETTTHDELESILADYVQISVLDQYVTGVTLNEILQSYVTNSELSNYVTYIDLSTTLEDYVTVSDLGDYITESDLTQALSSYVSLTYLEDQLDQYVNWKSLGTIGEQDFITVDGHNSNSVGNVSFGLAASKWLKSNAQGHITTTDETPIVIDGTKTGYLYNTNGTLSYKNEEYVTLNTHQIITASKTFDATQTFKSGVGIGMTGISGSSITMVDSTNNSPMIGMTAGNSTGLIGKTSTLMKVESDKILELQGETTVNVRGKSGINLNAPANAVTLAYSPNQNASTLSVATVGWTNSNFPKKGSTFNVSKWVKTDASGNLVTTNESPITLDSGVTGFLYNTKGTLSYLGFGSGANQVARGNHTHNTSALNNDAGFITETDVNQILADGGFVTEPDVEDIIDAHDFATQDDLEGYVTLNTPQLITAGKRFGPSQTDSLWIGKGAVNNSISSTTSPLSLYGDNVTVLLTAHSAKTSYIHLNTDGRIVADAPEQYLVTGDRLLMAGNLLSSLRILSNGSLVSQVDATDQNIRLVYGTGGWVTVDNNGVKMGDGASANGTFIIDNSNDKINLSEGGSTGSHLNMTNSEVVCKIGADGDYSKRIAFNNDQMALRHDKAMDIYTMGTGDEGVIRIWKGSAANRLTIADTTTLRNDNRIDITSPGENGTVVITAKANQAALLNPPTVASTNTTARAIATCGWTATNFAAKGTLANSKWVKTDVTGKLTTTDETPIVLNNSSTGFLYNNTGTLSYLAFGTGNNNVARGNHTHNTSALTNDAGFINAAGVNSIIDGRDLVSQDDLDDALADYVTLATAQTITGNKAFGDTWNTGTQFITGSNYNRVTFGRYTIMNTLNNNIRLTIQASGGEKYLDFNPSYDEIRLHSNGRTVIESSKMSYLKGEGVHLAATDSVGSDLTFVSLANDQVKMQCGSDGGNVLATNSGVQIGKGLNTYVSAANTGIGIGNGTPAVNINAKANETTLTNEPTVESDNTTSLAVATCGWVASKFQTKPETTVTAKKFVVTQVNWNGTQLTYTGEYWNFENGILKSVTPAASSTVIDTPVAY